MHLSSATILGDTKTGLNLDYLQFLQDDTCQSTKSKNMLLSFCQACLSCLGLVVSFNLTRVPAPTCGEVPTCENTGVALAKPLGASNRNFAVRKKMFALVSHVWPGPAVRHNFAARQLAADTINDLVEDFFNKLAQGAVA